jgi:hypothetical protein
MSSKENREGISREAENIDAKQEQGANVISWEELSGLDLIGKPISIDGFLPVAGQVESVSREGNKLIIKANHCKFGTQHGVEEARDQELQFDLDKDPVPGWLVTGHKILSLGRVKILYEQDPELARSEREQNERIRRRY